MLSIATKNGTTLPYFHFFELEPDYIFRYHPLSIQQSPDYARRHLCANFYARSLPLFKCV